MRAPSRAPTLAVLLALTASGLGPAWAQGSGTDAGTPPAQTPPAAQNPSPAAAPSVPAQSAPVQPVQPVPGKPATFTDSLRPTFVAQTPDEMVASKLIGLSIQNGANETIGTISDVVLDENAQVKAWVVGVGGFLGIGTKYVAVAASALKLDRSDAKNLKATINTDRDQLRAAPEYIYLGKEKPTDKASEASK